MTTTPVTIASTFAVDLAYRSTLGIATWAPSGLAHVGGQPYGYGTHGQQGPFGQFPPFGAQVQGIGSDVLAVSPAGLLTTASGALVVRIVRVTDTGAEEIIGRIGTQGSGQSTLRWGIDATDHPFCEWSSNNGAYQRLASTATIAAMTATTVCIGWSGTTQRLIVAAGSAENGTRAAPQASWGAGAIELRATGTTAVAIAPFAGYAALLSDPEWVTVRDLIGAGGDPWSLVPPIEAIIQPADLLALQSGEATAGARATVTPATIPLTAQSLTGTSGASAEVEAAELVVAGQAAKAGAIRQLPDTVEWSKP